MTDLTKGKLITKLGYVAHFNEQVWEKIIATARTVYHNGGNITLSQDKDTNVTLDPKTGAVTGSSTSNVTIAGTPRFSQTSYYGANTTTGAVKDRNPVAVTPSHLKTLKASQRQHFLLMPNDLTGNIATADVVYRACFNIISAIISIRPFKSTWQHESSEASKRFTVRFNNGNFAYGVFVDRPAPVSSATTGSGTWGAGGSLSRWQVTLGGDITSLNLQEDSVARDGVYRNNLIRADRTSAMVINFWNAWQNRCMAKNSFDYKYFSCHLNCHSSCHSSCHGSRSRR